MEMIQKKGCCFFMKNQIRELAAVLHRSHTPENMAYVKKRLQEMGLTLTDLFQQIEMLSRYVDAFRDEGYADISSPIHTHPFWEIAYCQSNCGAEYLIETICYQLQRGDIILIPPGVSHASLRQKDALEPYRGYTLWVSADCINGLQESFSFLLNAQHKGVLLRTRGTVWESLGGYFQATVGEAERQESGWDAIVIGNIIVILTQITRAITDLATPTQPIEKPELLERILAYIEENLSEKITLQDVANRFWVSQSTVAHLFTKKMGISFYKYVIQRRLTEAKNLILENMCIEKVCTQVGFNDYSAFYRAFRKEYGISPQQFQKIYCKAKTSEPN